ncbi:MAG: hypothetical protein ABSC08_09945 [Bryobacteraceae bacterium]|jgi:hypothetical protein
MNLLYWLSLLRVPISFWLVYGPGLILLMQPGMSLSRGFADLSPWQFLFVACALWCAATSLAATTNLVLLYGPRRIGRPDRPAPSSGWVLLAASVPSAASVCFLVLTAPQLDPGQRSVWLYALLALVSLAIVLLATIALLWLALRFAAPQEGIRVPAEVILPLSWVPGAERAYRAQSLTPRLHAAGRRASGRVARWLGPGYLDPRGGGLLSGHALSAFLAFGYLVLYAIGGTSVTFHGSVHRGVVTPVIGQFASALAFIVIILTLLGWVLGALAFLLDRWRVPVLTPFVLLAAISAFLSSQDHYFPVFAWAHPDRPSPTQVLESSKSGPRVVIVASAGGGIQAAAWTSTVMANLQRQDARFRDTVRLMSGVSGGSVGLYYSLRLYPSMEGSGISLDDLAQLGGTSVIEAIAHGVAYPWSDRGEALEDCLGSAGANHFTLGHYASLMLSAPGSLPAVIFNATSVEDGSPVAFSTTSVFANNTGLRDWFATDKNQGEDVQLPTAARLSATFPYVSPSARSWRGAPSFRHFGDGGYFDNYGLFSSMAWLEDALGSLSQERYEKLRVLLLAIESFPAGESAAPVSHGRLWQLLAPVALLYNARTYSQRSRDDLEVSLYGDRFAHVYELRPEQFKSVTLRCRQTPRCEDSPPLSWHLTPVEKNCVEASWQALLREPSTGKPTAELQQVLDFVAGR